MKVSELFEALSVGELNSLSISLDGSGDIDDIQKSKVMYFANQSLTALYTRFPHKIDYVKVGLSGDVYRYYLRDEHTVSNTDPTNTADRYIMDTEADPFEGPISKILSIRDDDAECFRDRDILINELSAENAVRKLSHDGFRVEKPVDGNVYLVEYQALHPKLSVTEPNDDELIELAPVLYEALTTRIASKVYKAMGNEDAVVKANLLMQDYEDICLRAEADDSLQLSVSNNHDKLREGGWK
jgi:hypothetical protein